MTTNPQFDTSYPGYREDVRAAIADLQEFDPDLPALLNMAEPGSAETACVREAAGILAEEKRRKIGRQPGLTCTCYSWERGIPRPDSGYQWKPILLISPKTSR